MLEGRARTLSGPSRIWPRPGLRCLAPLHGKRHLAAFHGFSPLFLLTHPFGMIRAARITGHDAAWGWQKQEGARKRHVHAFDGSWRLG